MAMKSWDYDYPLPYRSSNTESLFTLATRVVARHISSNLAIVQYLPPNAKSVLITLLGRQNLLTGPVLRSLAHKDLQSLSFSGSLVRDSTVNILEYLTKLKCLYIPSHEISSFGLVKLFPSLPFLEELDISSSNQVDDRVLLSMTDNCPMLHLINMGKCPKFTDRGFKYLATKMYNITVLDISHTMVTDNGMKALCEGPSSQKLHELHIDGCQQLTEKCGQSLEAFSRITMLSFYDCPRLTKSEWFSSFSSNQQKKLMKNISFTIE